MAKINFVDYIVQLGDKRAALKFKVTERTIKSWRLGQRKPGADTLAVILTRTKNLYSIAEIYAAIEEIRFRRKALRAPQ